MLLITNCSENRRMVGKARVVLGCKAWLFQDWAIFGTGNGWERAYDIKRETSNTAARNRRVKRPACCIKAHCVGEWLAQVYLLRPLQRGGIAIVEQTLTAQCSSS